MIYFKPLDISNREEYIALFEKQLEHDLAFISREFANNPSVIRSQIIEDRRLNSYEFELMNWVDATKKPLGLNKFLRFDKIDAVDGLMLLVGLIPISAVGLDKTIRFEEFNGLEYDTISFPRIHGYAKHLQSKFLELIDLSSINNADAILEVLTWETPFIRLDSLSISEVAIYFSLLDLPKAGASSAQIKWLEKHTPNHSNLIKAVWFDIKNRIDNLVNLSEIWDSGDHPDRNSLDYLLKWASTKQFNVSWKNYIAEQDIRQKNTREEPLVRKIAPARELVLKGWLTGKGHSLGHKFTHQSQQDIWLKLGKADATLFPPLGKKSIQAFFQNQNLCSFTLGRKAKSTKKSPSDK
jgi:hypothetical protein